MSKSKLVCTVELDLPDGLAEAHKAQGPLLEMWAQFVSALPDQGIVGVRVDSRVVKTKTPKTTAEVIKQTQEAAARSEESIPPFLKRSA